jgi:DNA-binding transcriptional MerR regulator
MAVPARAYLSIGEVLNRLRSDFADITISKIRFLESEGLIEPQRTPSGYRKFTSSDLERLRYVLLAQRDQYLPLKVIKDNLDAMDRGLPPAAIAGVLHPSVALATVDGEMAPSAFSENSEMRLSRDELLKSSGISDQELVEIESYGLIAVRGRHYDGDALAIAKAVTEMASFGIESRHLRSFKSAADREIGLIEQVISPLTRQKSTESKARAEEVQKEIDFAHKRCLLEWKWSAFESRCHRISRLFY